MYEVFLVIVTIAIPGGAGYAMIAAVNGEPPHRTLVRKLRGN